MNTLAAAIAALEARGGQHYDPVRFRFFEAMARRAAQHTETVASLIVAKALPAVQQYQQDFSQAATAAATSVALIEEKFPAASDKAQQYLAAQNFKAVAKLLARLEASVVAAEQQSLGLSGLTTQILQGVKESGPELGQASLDDCLRQQESDLLQSWSVLANKELSVTAKPNAAARSLGELKSVRLFRESWSKIHSEQRVTHSINDGPEAPGPLNEQKLMIRSLETMRELSPQYLSRFVAYMDTLLWLEQAGKKVATIKFKPKKKARVKKQVD